MAAPRLLVVDDSPDIAFIVRRLGRHAGHDVDDCGDAVAAWDYLQGRTIESPSSPSEGERGGGEGNGLHCARATHTHTPHPRPLSPADGGEAARQPPLPDLVLLDVNLPGTSGPELCRRLRATPGLDGLPVAVFCHWDRPGDMAAGLAAGADFVLSKELLTRPEAWTDRVREMLAWPHGRTARQLLSSPGVARLPVLPEIVTQALNPALRHALPAHAGPQVLPVLAERSLQAVFWWASTAANRDARPPRPRPLADVPDGWLLPSGLGLAPDRLARLRPPGAVIVFAVALVEQVACVTPATAPAREALAAAVPALEEVLAHP
jgi:CheY-like chemotaxis protein